MAVKKIKSRKGEITTTQLVTSILLVLGFSVILYFLGKFVLSERIDKETCHQSVIMRGTLPDTLLIKAKGYIPLKCGTAKYCISSELIGKDCDEDFAALKYTKVKVSKNLDKQEQEIKTFLAREMADCWGMMGEGKIQVFTKEIAGLNQILERCVVCSRIAFGKSIKEARQKANKDKINGLGYYLFSHKVPEKDISYWEFLGQNTEIKGYDSSTDFYSLNQKAIVFREVVPSTLSQWTYGMAGLISGGVAGGQSGAYVGGIIGSIVPGAGTVAGATIGFIGGSVVGFWGGAKIGSVVDAAFISQLGDKGYASGYVFGDYDVPTLSSNCKSFEELP